MNRFFCGWLRSEMTKKDGFPFEIGCEDPRSQKRDLGHPSVLTDGLFSSTLFVGRDAGLQAADDGFRDQAFDGAA